MSIVCRTYALDPNGIQKSFYGKAIVVEYDNGDRVLESYGLPVIRINGQTGEIDRLVDGWYQLKRGAFWTEEEDYVEWSPTTGRHIRAFCGIDKATWDKMEVVTM